jgi:SAM-dependent methyltransferase
MAEIFRKEIYRSLPLIYNHLMRKIRYDYWADYIFRLTSKYVPKDAFVLELAAGNCRLADNLIKKFPNLIVSDLSYNMLANPKSETKNKVCCNMLFMPFRKKFDMIYLTFDSINYLLTRKKVLSFFVKIKEQLNNEGVFAFDASLEKNSISHIKEPNRRGRYKRYNYLHRSIYNKKTHIHKNIFEITLQDGKIFKETHKQKILDYYEYFDLIEQAKLYVIECFDAFTFNDAKANSKRVQFVVKKIKE